MDNKLFILLVLIAATYSTWQGLIERKNNIITISIKIRYLGAGIMLFIAAIIMIVQELN